MDAGDRCPHCSATDCHGLCSGKAAWVERQRVIVYLKAKGHPLADKWAKEIEKQVHIEASL